MSNGDTLTSKNENPSDELYYVLKNHEEQYSIWPHYKSIPLGWEIEGEVQDKSACLDYIKKVWTDMRPLSLRKKMEEMAKEQNSRTK